MSNLSQHRANCPPEQQLSSTSDSLRHHQSTSDSNGQSSSDYSDVVAARQAASTTSAQMTAAGSEIPEGVKGVGGVVEQALEQRQGLEQQLSYWKQQLRGSLPVLELPTDRPRPAVLSSGAGCQSLRLSSSLVQALKGLSRQEEVTLFTLLLAAFKSLLYRYTGQEDIIVGSRATYRDWRQSGDQSYSVNHSVRMAGLFSNMLALRSDLSGDPSFQELLKRVREVVSGAQVHEAVSFEKLIEELQLNSDTSRAPLFQVTFEWHKAPQPVMPQSVMAEEINAEEIGIGATEDTVAGEMIPGAARFDLKLLVVEEAEELQASLEYSSDLFKASTARRMLRHWETLLEGVVADPRKRLWQLPLLTAAERLQLLLEWNQTQADYPADKCLHELFEAQVEKTPDAVAVVFEDEKLSYAELNGRANQLGHYLQKLGVGPEVLVGICVERSLEMVVGLLGVLKAGGAYVPLDPVYPRERLAVMVEDAAMPVLLSQQRLRGRLPEDVAQRAQIVYLEEDWAEIGLERTERVQSGVSAQNLAYVIYTSGSTGKPKGAMILHQGLVNYLTWCTQAYAVAAGQGTPVHSSISFDLTVTGLFAPLLVGRSVYLLPEDLGVEALTTSLGKEPHFSLVKITPAHLELLSQQLSPQKAAGCTKAFIIGGENLLAESIAFWQKYAPDTALINEYGPTETVVGCCVYQVPPATHEAGTIPIGRPIANTQLYILDHHLQPAPIGVPGELHIGGAGLARGYLNRSELTAEKFIPHPFSDEPGARLYKTGDLARYREDGNIECLGRIDHQVKIRGFRIELGEIESILSQHAAVREVVVTAREDTPGDKRLVAYWVAAQWPAPSPGELRQFARDMLPEYMVPSAFVLLNTLPLTPNGKIDRRALPTPQPGRAESQSVLVAPRDMLEVQLTAMWERLLNVRPIGVKDNFFDLGGYSLLAVKLFAEIEKLSGKNLSLAALFQAPTVEQLANVLRQEGWSPHWRSLVEMQVHGSRTPLFLVHANRGHVLFYRELVHHMGADQPVYGLQAQGLDGKQAPYTRVEDMASHYIKEIRGVQANGPYNVAGSGFGARVGFEIVQQLYARGEEANLIILDAKPPRHWPSGEQTQTRERVAIVPATQRRHYVRRLMRSVRRRRVAFGLLRRGKKSNVKAQMMSPQDQVLQRVKRANSKADRTYIARVYPGRVTLFVSDQTHRKDKERPLNWSRIAAGGVDCHLIPGQHNTWGLEPHIQVVAKQLRTCLDRMSCCRDEKPYEGGQARANSSDSIS